MSDKKYREFWLNERLERIYKDSDASCPDDEIHVISFQAYADLKDENERLRHSLKKIVEILK